jgi:chromosomal replication initiation ATPase DnaA
MEASYVMSTCQLEHEFERRYKQLGELPQKVQHVVIDVCAEHSVSITRVLDGCQRRPYARARQEIIWRLRHMPWGAKGKPPSLPQIGRWLGRDHTSVLHAYHRHAGTMADAA